MKITKSKLLDIITEEYENIKTEGGKGSGRKPEDHTGGPSYANVPKGAKTSKQAKAMKKKSKIEKEMDKAVSDANAKLDAAEKAMKKKKIKEGSLDWEKHFKGFNKKELSAIESLVMMSAGGISDVLRDYKKNKSAFKAFIKDMVRGGMFEGKLTEMDNPWFEITYKDSRGRKKTDSMRAKSSKEAKKDFVNLMKGRGFKVLKVVKEGRTRLSPSRDLEIHTKGSMAVLYGKKHKLAIDKESMKKLVDLIRRNMGLYELRKLKEGKSFKLPNGMKIEFINQQQIVLSRGGKRVYLDVGELRMFLKGVKKDMGVRA